LVQVYSLITLKFSNYYHRQDGLRPEIWRPGINKKKLTIKARERKCWEHGRRDIQKKKEHPNDLMAETIYNLTRDRSLIRQGKKMLLVSVIGALWERQGRGYR
jgi:hypothetical protein